jgi:hypothetical protein
VSEGVKRISCLTHCFVSLRVCVCVCAESNFKKMIEDMSETQQWDMRKWKKTIEVPLPHSLLHCSTTPLLHHTTTPLHHCTTTPLHHYSTAPLLHCLSVSCTRVCLHSLLSALVLVCLCVYRSK